MRPDKFLLRLFILLLVVSTMTQARTKSVAMEDPTGIKRVVIIGVDGAGAFFREADTPNLDKIFANGAVSYDVLTSKPTISAQCWGAMLHGVTPEFHRLTNSIVSSQPYPPDSAFPSIFRVVRENDPDAKMASFCNWNPVNIGIIEDGLGIVKGTGNDANVTAQACEYLKENDPTILFIHYDEVDGAGHGAGYGTERHLAQIHTTDGYIQQVYEALKNRDMLDSTLFMVTADHGGQGRSHGGWTDAEKYIMLAATGPGIVQGSFDQTEVRDISSIVLYALGLADKQPETWTSRVPSNFFKGVEAKERPVYTVQYQFKHREHEPVETPVTDAGVAAILGKERVQAYFNFDNNAQNVLGVVDAVQNGNLYYEDGYFGQGARFDDGYVTLNKAQCDKSSFSIALWMKTGGVDTDPAILSNKDWRSGLGKGFVLSLRVDDVKFNLGNAQKRFDPCYSLPFDYVDGWVYVVLVVDRDANQVKFSYDFADFIVQDIPTELQGNAFETNMPVNLGQDGTGQYANHLGAVLDEVVLINGALSNDDLAKLKTFYQSER